MYRLRGTTELGWLRDLEPSWEGWADSVAAGPAGAPGTPFGRGLLISLDADAGALFLDPADRDENGEWAAYSVFSWADFPQRYPSFTALMESLYQETHRMRRPAGKTRDDWDAAVEQAQSDALAGDIDRAMPTLEKAQDFGRPRATVLRVQLLMFLGTSSPYEASRLLSRLLPPASVPDGFFTGPLFTEEFLPCMFLQHTNKEPWYGSALEVAQILQTAQNDQGFEIGRAIDEHRARVQQPGYRLTYGNQAFDTAVRSALAVAATDSTAMCLPARNSWRSASVKGFGIQHVTGRPGALFHGRGTRRYSGRLTGVVGAVASPIVFAPT